MQALIRHLTDADYSVSQWSGGLTKQIAICPQDARYADRDFLWRVSSATVETEHSEFTPLPDYDRFLSLLAGELAVTHEGQPFVLLRPYDVHTFDGGVATRSQGRCTDFNLMLRKGRCTGNLSALRLANGQQMILSDVGNAASADTLLLYCARGSAELQSEHQAVWLLTGQAALIEHPAGNGLRLSCEQAADVLLAQITCL